MSQRSTWPPVYTNLTDETTARLAMPKVASTDTRLIIATVGNTAILTYIQQLAIKHAADYIRDNKLTFVDSDRFIEHLRQRSVATPPHSTTDASNESGPDSRANKQIANIKNIVAKSRKKS